MGSGDARPGTGEGHFPCPHPTAQPGGSWGCAHPQRAQAPMWAQQATLCASCDNSAAGFAEPELAWEATFLEDPGQKGSPRALSSPAFASIKTPIYTNQIVHLAT